MDVCSRYYRVVRRQITRPEKDERAKGRFLWIAKGQLRS